MIGGIIATHGTLGASIIQTVKKIIGDVNSLIGISNDGLSLDEMDNTLRHAIDQLSECSDIIIFVELMGGSTWNVSNRLSKKHSNLYVISGVNMPMLISFLTKRQNHAIRELVDVIKQDAIRGIHLASGEF